MDSCMVEFAPQSSRNDLSTVQKCSVDYTSVKYMVIGVCAETPVIQTSDHDHDHLLL